MFLLFGCLVILLFGWVVLLFGKQQPSPIPIDHGFVAEEFAIPAVYVVVFLYVALEESCGLGCNIWFQRHFFYSGKVVAAFDVDVPAPVFEKAYVEGVGRAEEGATHTHQAAMVEGYLASHVAVYVFDGASFDTHVAVDALVFVYLVEKGVDVACYVLRTRYYGCD